MWKFFSDLLTLNCGPASYQMVEAFYKGFRYENTHEGMESARNDLKAILSTLEGIDSSYDKKFNYYGSETNINQIAELAITEGGFNAAPYHIKKYEELKEILKSQHPIIVAVYTNMSYTGNKNIDVKHFMVLVGYDEITGNVTVKDPGRSWEKGKAKGAEYFNTYPIADFKKCFEAQNNASVLIYPPGEALPLGVVVKTTILPDGVIGQNYTGYIGASGGTSPYSYSYELAKGSTLPDGLTLSANGKISGAPTKEGAYEFFVEVNDKYNWSGTKITLRINSPAQNTTPKNIEILSAENLPPAQQGKAYNQWLSAALSFANEVVDFFWSLWNFGYLATPMSASLG